MDIGQRRAYETYWEACEMLEEAGIPVRAESAIEEIIRYVSQEVGDLVEAALWPSDS